MADRICSVPDCSVKTLARGWCSKHYQRWKRQGDPMVTERRAPGPCVVTDCSTEGDGGHGLCHKHYRRHYRRGDPLATSRIVGDDVARFESYIQQGPTVIDKLGACWLWTGLLNKDGYAVMASDLPTASAHRWSYRHHVGPLLPGLELDHLCRVRNCVNPWHLDPVTPAVNKQRAAQAKREA